MQGAGWTMADLVKDMLELHDPDCISQVHDHLLQKDSVLQKPTRASVYADCIADYTDWFNKLADQFPVQDLLYTAARTESATRASVWQVADMPDSCSPLNAVNDILTASSLHLLKDPPRHWLSVMCNVEGCSNQDLVDRLSTISGSSSYAQSLLLDVQPEIDIIQSGNWRQQPRFSAPAPLAFWRLFAIALQRDVYIIDVHHGRICCYSSHSEALDVHGTANCCNQSKQWCMRSWQQPGFFYVLGKLPIPTALSSANSAVFVMPDAASVQGTAKLNVEPETISAAASRLKNMGISFADLHFISAGEP